MGYHSFHPQDRNTSASKHQIPFDLINKFLLQLRSKAGMLLFVSMNRAISGSLALAGVLGLATASGLHAQPAPQETPPQTSQADKANTPAAAQPAPDSAQAPASPQAGSAPSAQSANGDQTEKSEPPGGITEEELKRMLLGKPLFLRGNYLSDSLNYNEHGALIGHVQQTSYTLCGIQIDRVHLTKHKLELEGARYGLHFLGALPYEDPTKAVDRVKITPKKKVVKITIDREVVVKPKKEKSTKQAKASADAKEKAGIPAAQPAETQSGPGETSEEDQKKAEIAAATDADRPADPNSVTMTTSPAHAAKLLEEALDNIFAPGIDDRLIAAMPDFWKLYYQAAAAKTDYQPADSAVMRQTTVDQKAKLLSNFEPASNQFAQDNGVAGMSLYHVVIDAEGKPGEIAVARPIGFGLDENAVEAIRNAKFEPAIKDGKPVPVLLDLVVQFRIYSKRTAVSGSPSGTDRASGPPLPGPFTAAQEAKAAQDAKPAR